MPWFQSLLIIALILFLLVSIQFYQFWKKFKELKVGETLSNELINEFEKKIRIMIILFAIGSTLVVIGLIFRLD